MGVGVAFQPKGPSPPPGSPPISACNDMLPSGAACPGGRGACGGCRGGPPEAVGGQGGRSLARQAPPPQMAISPLVGCEVSRLRCSERFYSVCGMGLPAGSSRKQAPGARGLGRASPLRGDGREATIAKCGGARSARSCVLYAARSSGLRRTSRTSARPHRRSPCRRSGGAGLCRRCGSGCGGAGCKGGGGVVAASRRDAHRSCTASSLPRRRCRTSWLRRPLAAAEPLRRPLGWRPSDGVAVRSESRITNVAPSRRPRCRGEGRSGA